MQTHRRRRRLLATAWVIVLALGLGAGSISLAFFVDQEGSSGGFTSGTVNLGLTPSTNLVSMAGMVPGSQVSAPLTLQNTGTGSLRYSMTASTTDPDGKHLRDVLVLTIERRTGCGGTVLETLYNGPIGSALFGDPRAGNDAGDRTLATSASEVLCFRATLPTDTDPLYGSAATTLSLTFWSEQTVANP
ncbi:MAG: hypothetical protein HY264_04700 [Chloroflexi bacterium]|nr:hypothetical protein [Chloroflexota bacterium]